MKICRANVIHDLSELVCKKEIQESKSAISISKNESSLIILRQNNKEVTYKALNVSVTVA